VRSISLWGDRIQESATLKREAVRESIKSPGSALIRCIVAYHTQAHIKILIIVIGREETQSGLGWRLRAERAALGLSARFPQSFP
jgi:hypothetical protein